MMKVLYLYSEIMGYQIPILKELVNTYSARVIVVHWDYHKLTPYAPPDIEGVTFYRRSTFNKKTLADFVVELAPDITYVSGWQDRGYLPAIHQLKKRGTPIIVAFDDQWTGSVRQHIGSVLLRYYFKERYFSYAWVAGPYQYEYARRMGFRKDEIVFDLLSCDASVFSQGVESLKSKALQYPMSFLYVGNFRTIKGTDILAEAFTIYKEEYGGEWGLVCVGNGPLERVVRDCPGVEVRGFSSAEELVEISKRCGAFILPSRRDQWGVVVHEFASSGLPLILSENVGARAVFLIDGYNGYRYSRNSPRDLADKMKLLSSKNPCELVAMGYRSSKLADRISPSSSVASLMSVLSQ